MWKRAKKPKRKQSACTVREIVKVERGISYAEATKRMRYDEIVGVQEKEQKRNTSRSVYLHGP